MRAQDCNLVLFNATGSPLFSSNTGPNSGLNPPSQPPCHLTVSGAGGGQITIIDSYMHGQLSDTVVYTRPKVGNAQLVSGQELDQVWPPAQVATSNTTQASVFDSQNLIRAERAAVFCG